MRRAAALATVLVLALPAGARAAELPDWLAQARLRPPPPDAARAAAVVLHDEGLVRVPDRGRVESTLRRVVRVQSRDGRDHAVAVAHYVKGSSEVKSLRAWTLDADGRVLRRSDRADATDLSDLSYGQLYTEFRRLVLEDPLIQPGQVFAYESVIQEEPLFAQWRWWFDGALPSAWSRFALTLPAGLEVVERSAHLDSARVLRDGSTWSWERGGMRARPEEPLAPWRPDLAGYLCVQAVDPSGPVSPAGRAFRDWEDASRWLDELTAAQSRVGEGLAARARAIAGATTDTLARIGALGRYVQQLNYVSHDLNISRGWGYRPHEAGEVLAAGYGDCKDKANLLRALLAAEGIEAWLLPVFSGDRDRVDSAWASPAQFDHCITAVRVPASYTGPRFDAGPLGRLAAFDPTDPLTAFGDLPESEQGSLALLVAPSGGRLVRLPPTPAPGRGYTRRFDAVLDESGALSAVVVERSLGQDARRERELSHAGAADYAGVLEGWLGTQGGAIALDTIRTFEDSLRGRFELRIAYRSPRFARVHAGRLMSFRTSLAMSRRSWVPTDSTRTLPIALRAESLAETLVVRLPAGFALDERPADLRETSDLGELDARWSESGGVLVMTRTWRLAPRTVGPERWADVRRLYAALRASNEATVVLARP